MYKALLIGINYTGTGSQLYGCINDVKHMQQFLIDDCAVPPENIRIMTDDTKDCLPTRKNIIKAFAWLTTNATSHSRLFLHYSGHGGSTRDLNNDERDGRDETIIPLDYRRKGTIVDDDLRKLLVDPLPKGCRLTCVFDCCHSGTVLDLRYNYHIKPIGDKQTVYEIRKDKAYPKTKAHVVLFSGCMDQQTSADAWEERTAQGAMTHCLLKSLRRKNQTKLTYKRLFDRLLHYIKRKGYQQTPQMSTGSLIQLDDEFHL